MSKLKKKFGRRILAFVLSGAMIMSNMTAFASEAPQDTGGGYTHEQLAAADEVLESEDNNSNEKDDEKVPSDGTAEETEVKVVEQPTGTKTSDNEQTSETKSSFDVEEEEAEDGEESSSSKKEEKPEENVNNKGTADSDGFYNGLEETTVDAEKSYCFDFFTEITGFDYGPTEPYKLGLFSYKKGEATGNGRYISGHGIAFKPGNELIFPVSGNSYIVINKNNSSKGNLTASCSDANGKFYANELSLSEGASGVGAAADCKNRTANAVAFEYTGDAGTVTLTVGNGGESYIGYACVIPMETREEDATVWDFSSDKFTGTSPWMGLRFTSGSKNKTYLAASTGKITVPIKSDIRAKKGKVVVTANYAYNFSFANEANEIKGPNGRGSDAFEYYYEADTETVDINIKGTTYIEKIEVVADADVDITTDKEWDFTQHTANTGGAITDWDGLSVKNGNKHNSYGLAIQKGSILVPVQKDCMISLDVGYTWEIGFYSMDNPKNPENQTTNGGDKTITYEYVGGKGRVPILVGNTATYIKKLSVKYREGATVSGHVRKPESLSENPTLIFTCRESGEVIEAEVNTDGSYTKGGFKAGLTYMVSLKDLKGYDIVNVGDKAFKLPEGATEKTVNLMIGESVTSTEIKHFTLEADKYEAYSTENGAGEILDGRPDSFFKIYMNNKFAVDGSGNTEFIPGKDDYFEAYTGTRRFNFTGNTTASKRGEIEFTITGHSLLWVYWSSGAAGQYLVIRDEQGDIVQDEDGQPCVAEGAALNTPYASTFTIPAAGTYYISSASKSNDAYTYTNGNYIYKADIATPVEVEPDYVAAGNYDLANVTDLTLPKFNGIEFDGIGDGKSNSHGIVTTKEGAEMRLNLRQKANITVITCGYMAGLSAAMEASKGELSGEEVLSASDNGNGWKFVVTEIPAYADNDKQPLILKFSTKDNSGKGIYIHSITVEYIKEVPKRETIDVWDFGGKMETNTNALKYTNHVTVDVLKGLKTSDGSKALISGGIFAEKKETAFDDLKITHEANDRLYSSDASLSGTNLSGSYTPAKVTYEDGYISDGGYYCNGTGGSGRRFLTIENVQAGDKIVAYIGLSQNGPSKFYFEGQGAAGKQKNEVNIDAASFAKFEFVAEYTGTYKIWENNAGKPMYHRIMRIPGVKVSGSIDTATNNCTLPEGYKVKFTNTTTDQVTWAKVERDGAYTVTLAPGYEYRASLTEAKGFGFTNASKVITISDEDYLDGISNKTLVAETIPTYQYSGSITGFADDYDKRSNVKVVLVPSGDADKVELEITDKTALTFTADILAETEYVAELIGVDDYEIISDAVVKLTSDKTDASIIVALKDKRNVTGGFIDVDGKELTGLTLDELVFTLVDSDGKEDANYSYPAEIAGDKYTVSLRDGDYIATVKGDSYRTTTHIVVDGTAVKKDLMLVSTAAKEPLPKVSDIYVGYPNEENNYPTMRKAMEACERMKPASEEERITVHIAPATYREQIIVKTPYISFVNDEPDKEVLLTWYYGIGYKYYSADSSKFYNPENAYDKYDKHIADRWGVTVRVEQTAKAFRAEGITFENSFNRYITDEEIADGVECTGETLKIERNYSLDVESKAATERAAVMEVDADEVEFKNCGFYSSQDTLYTQGKHIYFKNCTIEGMTDYIFGTGNCVFDACELSWKGYSEKEAEGYITAAKVVEDEQGYLFRNCTVTGNPKLKFKAGYFGRPWEVGAKVRFLNTRLENEKLIDKKGWGDWKTGDGSAAKSEYYEYNTTTLTGEPVDTSGRVRGVMTKEDADKIKVTDYFGSWTPAYYQAEAEILEFKTVPFITSNGDLNTPYPGNTLTVGYSLGENDANDVSLIQWYRVKGEEETLLKTSNATTGKTYKLATADTGCYIKVVVTPTTVSGKIAESASFTMVEPVREGYEDPDNPGADPSLGDGVNLFLVGDSTVRDYSASGINSGGSARDEGAWGEFLQSFFDSEKVTVVNYANGGRSTRNFINEGSLNNVAEKIGEGDYMFIQFGHNDCSNIASHLADRYVPLGEPDANGVYPTTAGQKVPTPAELADKKYGSECYTYDCGGTFKWYLQQYIDVAKENGAIPVLVTPVSRMYYNSDGTIKAHHDSTDAATNTQVTSNNAYVTAVKQLADEQDVLLIDGFELTKTLFEDAYKAAGDDSYGQQIMHTGDKTHNNKLGGMIEAAVIAAAIQNMDLNISKTVQAPSKVVGMTTKNKTVFEVDKDGKLTAYDIISDYAEKASYWTEVGQKMFDAIGKKAGEIKPAPGEETVGAIIPSPDPKEPVGKNTKISLDCVTKGATIYYTTDGTTDPTVKEELRYTEPISLGETEGTVTIKAIAVKEGMKNSEIFTFVYTVSAEAPEQVAAPEADPKPEAFTKGTPIKLTSSTPDAQIYYTLDDAVPSKDSGTLYTEPVSLGEAAGTVTLNAIAVKEGFVDSAVSTFAYTIPETPVDPDDPENPDEEQGDTEESKIVVGTDSADGTISVRDTKKIKIEAADLVESKKVQYAVTVTYTYTDENKASYQQQLTEGVHYTVSFVNDGSDGKTVGAQKINISGTGQKTDLGTFTGKKTVAYEIKAKADVRQDAAHDITKAKIKLKDVKNAVYTGTYITPGVEVEGVDDSGYSVTYKNNVNVGKASVTVSGRGEYYGSKTLTFNIKKADISKQTVTIEASNATIEGITGKSRTAVEKAKGDLDYKGKAVTLKNLTVKLGAVKLSPRADYTIAYKKNAQAGTATVTIKGANNLSGAINVSYQIGLIDIKDALAACNTTETALPAEYSSKGSRLTSITLNGVTLNEGTDYKVNYKGCKKADELTIGETETVKVTGAGSYKSSDFKDIEVYIKVEQGSYHVKDGAIVDRSKLKSDVTKDNKTIINAAKITDAAGVKLKAEAVDGAIEIINNTKVKINPVDVEHYKGESLPCHVATKLSSVKPADKKAKIADRKFDGVNAVTLTETEIINARVLSDDVKASDIRIVSYKNNNKAGSATVTIEGRNSSAFYGTKSLKFKIVVDKNPALGNDTNLYPDDEPGTGDGPGTGDTPGTGDDPGTGDNPGTGDDPGTGENPGTGDDPGTGENPGTGDDPGTGENPGTGDEPTKATIWVVGDSTVSGFQDDFFIPRQGYGEQIANYFNADVYNLAQSGAASKDFVDMTQYKTLMNGSGTVPKLGEVETEGKYLIIGFGHNDEKAEDARYTNPNGDYKTEGSFAKSLYDNYIKPAIDVGVTPVVATPIVRLTSKNTAESYTGTSVHVTSDNGKYQGGDYAQAIRDLCAVEEIKDKVILVDLTTATRDLNVALGDGAKWMHSFPAGEYEDETKTKIVPTLSSVDSTHTNSYGAKMNAWLIGDLTKDTPLGNHFTKKDKPSYEADFAATINPDYKPIDYTAPTEEEMEGVDWPVYTDASGRQWYGTVFGDVGGADKITAEKFKIELKEDGSINLETTGQGKIASKSDAYLFYYTRLPAGTLFELSAKAQVNSFDANDQVSYGIMARDDLYINQSITKTMGDYVAAGTYKQGAYNCFGRKSGKLNNGPAPTNKYITAGDVANLRIASNPDGFAMKFGENDAVTQGFDYPLNKVDTKYIYVGFYVTRKASVTFSDINLTIKE